MRTCQFCAAEIPNNAEFCGSCGQLAQSAAGMTHVPRPMHRVVLAGEQTPQSDTSTALTQQSEQREAFINARTGPIEYEEDEEEKRRRLALVNFSLPLLADAGQDLPTANLPTAQGTPQATGAPTAAGTPPVIVNNPPPMAPPTTPLVLPPPQIPVRPPGGIYGTRLPHRPGPTLSGKPQPQPAPGCVAWLITLLVVMLVILASIIGAGLTILTPSLSMQGSADVTPGGTLHLHGSHFIPGNAVTCTLDGSTVLPFATTAYPTTDAATSAASWALAIQNDQTLQATSQATSTTTISVNGDGTFNASFTVEQSWGTGQHTIQATEALSPRSASVTFTVSGAGQQTATPGATVTATASATTTPSKTPTTTPTTTGLSAISPQTVTLGPIGEGNNQAVTSQATLSAGGSDPINWTATWDKTQAPWLQLNPQSGQIQAPGTQNITVGALAGTLQAGTYNAAITFSNNAQSGQSVTLNVALTVQAGCLTATPTTLNFAGTVNANDPPRQSIALNNCGARGNWSATSSGAPWLNVTPTNGTLNAGATQSVVVSTSIAGAGSKAGTYQSQIQFTNGTASSHATVAVTFVVKAAPVPAILSVNATTLTTRLNCKLLQSTKGVTWHCPITLSSSANATNNLNWTSISSGITGTSTQPASGTLTPGQSATVEIDIPRFPCDETGSTTFFGPANNVTVTVGC
ncbi:MAG: hypothetical protein M3Y39_13585 [Chloroflexota bacterium]|nr:hypothetical protein [Chloroflexota bacterium]